MPDASQLPGDALSRLLALHKPYSIYEECGHDHFDDAEGENGVVYVPEIGATCKKAYDICAECCTDGAGEQSEECASEHKHGEGIAICGTALILSHETFQSNRELTDAEIEGEFDAQASQSLNTDCEEWFKRGARFASKQAKGGDV